MGIKDKWTQYRELKRSQGQREALLDEWIERMVEDSEPSMRSVTGYQQQLRKPLENALGYMEGVIATIPGPFDLSGRLWDQNPLVHALFATPGEVQTLLQNCGELTSFFQEGGGKTAVVLLTARKEERTVFATAVEGEILRRDVPRKAVEFYEHRVVAPMATAEEIRRELVHRGLNVIAMLAIEEVTRDQAIREELTAERRNLEFKIKLRRTRERGLETLLAGGLPPDAEDEKAQQLLAEIDQQLRALEPGAGAPRDVLRKLESILTSPDTALTAKTLEIRLDRMGMKQNEAATEDSQAIVMAELEIPGRLKRVAMLATVAADDLLKS
ncbi:MAG: hypothetical protein LJE63_16655 [Desulfobacteraceae bacterium]|jgi:hypothetical protein|nr:hypothetical protein [Desulfobacteraceae bacterium]